LDFPPTDLDLDLVEEEEAEVYAIVEEGEFP
jgi:hypothetical protein